MSELIDLVNAYRMAVSTKAKQAALEEALVFINPSLYLFFVARVSDAEAKDLRSKTLVEIAKGLKQINRSTSPEAWSWCFTIAKRSLAKHYEEKKKSVVDSMDPAVVAELLDESEKQKPFDSDDEKTAVQEALELLKKSDEDCFYALWDNFVVGFTYDDMAARTGRTYDAVRMEVSRCLDKLEPILKQIFPHGS